MNEKDNCSWAEWASLPEYTQRLRVAGRRPGGKQQQILAEIARYTQLYPDAKIAIVTTKKREEEHMYIHIQVRGYRKAMGELYQHINDTSHWTKVDAIFHDYLDKKLILDIAQSDTTEEQTEWLANNPLVEKWWITWGMEQKSPLQKTHDEILLHIEEALQAEGITNWGEGGRLGDTLLGIKDILLDEKEEQQ